MGPSPPDSCGDDKPSGVHRQVQSDDAPSVSRIRKPWEVVEEFAHEGYCYRLQRRPLEEQQDTPLAKREEQTLELASAGLSRKQIAETLGLAPSTVGVLLHRAAIKLGAHSRSELLSSYRERLTQHRKD